MYGRKTPERLKTNKDTEIAEKSLTRDIWRNKTKTGCQLKRGMISHLQSRGKENLLLKHSLTCKRKTNKN